MSNSESDGQANLSPLKRALRAVEDMRARLEALEYEKREPIAVIGLGCRFPGGADSPEAFWRNLRAGIDSVSRVPPDRWDADAYYDPDPDVPGKIVTREGAFVENVHDLDAQFFGVSAHAARGMDPQQKMLLEVAWEAIEHAGISPDALRKARVGVFMGLWSFDYWTQLMMAGDATLDAHGGESMHSLAAGRLSYGLDVHGPCMVVDTACSTSLVTIHLACQSLRSRECRVALAGGTNVILSAATSIGMTKKKVLAPDGRCKAFDARGDGFGRGEGCGVVLLKRLSDAVEDGDRILALIRGSAVNHDGRGSEMSVPNGAAQEQVVKDALSAAGLSPADVHYVEAHGTGTAVGDPIEVNALAAAYSPGRAAGDPLYLGSVKTNIAHLETAAGAAGFIKTVLALEHEMIPRNLHFEQPNPRIGWDALPVKVVTEPLPWPRGDKPRLAGVSSFGISGTNAHVIVEEAPAVPANGTRSNTAERSHHLLPLSAKSARALEELAARYQEYLGGDCDATLADICHTAATGRAHFRHRLGVVAKSRDELRSKLASVCDGATAANVARANAPLKPPRLAFLFTGQGSQYIGMGRRLYEAEPTFRESMDRCDAILREYLEVPLLSVLYPAAGKHSPLDETAYTQPALFALEYALARTLQSWGITPSLVLGHSVGEYAAACIAGVLTLEHGLALTAQRGALMQALPRDGAMVNVFAEEVRVVEAIARHASQVSIAGVNGPSSVVISGRRDAVAQAVESLKQSGIETKSLNVSHAFHSPCIEPMMEKFAKVVGGLELRAPEIPLVSNVTGVLARDEMTRPEYWVQHIRRPVRFADGIRAAHAAGCTVFVEVGPKPTLSSLGRQCVTGDDITWLPCLREGQDDWDRLLSTVAELYARGADVRWPEVSAHMGARRVVLPTYPFQRQTFVREITSREADGSHVDAVSALLATRDAKELVAQLVRVGGFERNEAILLSKLLGLVREEHERRQHAAQGVVGNYYDELTSMLDGMEAAARAGDGDAGPILNFAPIPDVVPGFSWVLALTSPEKHRDQFERVLDAQRQTRAVLFRNVDLESCRNVLDFGCGYGSDVVSLARTHPHLNLCGFTLSPRQAEIGNREAQRHNVAERVRILQRNSAKDEFPTDNDLVFGFEVACHIKDKGALFDNVQRNLRDGGHLLLADFVSNAEFEIAHEETSSYLVTQRQWVDLFSSRHLRIVDCVDISPQIANFLYDPDGEERLAKNSKVNAHDNVRKAFHSYTRLGNMLREGLTSYVLLTVRKDESSTPEALRKNNQEVLEAPQAYDQAYPRRWLYEIAWREKPRQADAARVTVRAPGEPRGWLVLGDGEGQGAALAERLESSGARCVQVIAGEGLAREAPARWRIAAEDFSNYPKLLDEVTGAIGPLAGVVHLFSLDTPASPPSTLEALEQAHQRSALSALGLMQAVAQRTVAAGARCWFVTRGAAPVGAVPIALAQAPLWGLGKVFATEHPERWGGLIDLDPQSDMSPVDAIFHELNGKEVEDQLVLRAGRRYAPRLVRCARPVQRELTIRADATYVVTGGLGGLGIRVARWLVARGARQIALISRSGEPSKTGRAVIEDLKTRGARIEVFAADVASRDAMQRVLGAVDSSMAPVRGIVHAAGVAAFQTLESIRPADYARVAQPKVAGTWLLHELTRDKPLDFFVCFSSIAALWGPKGAAHYAAGNQFLDAFAHHHRSQGANVSTINWGPWSGGGMADDESLSQLARSGVLALHPKQAVETLDNLLRTDAAQTAVTRMDWSVFKDAYQSRGPRTLLDEIESAATQTANMAAARDLPFAEQLSSTPPYERVTELQKFLCEKAAKILGFDSNGVLDPDATLLELGFDSLMAVQLRNTVKAVVGIDIAVVDLLDSASIAALTASITEQLARPNRGEPLAGNREEGRI